MRVDTEIGKGRDKKCAFLDKLDFVIAKDVLYCKRCFELI